jgi:tetratricopeptide (TPR) repeat protein
MGRLGRLVCGGRQRRPPDPEAEARPAQRRYGRKRAFLATKLGPAVLCCSLAALAGEPDPVAEGDELREKGELAAARTAYDRAIEADSARALAWHRRGLLRRQTRDFEGALGDLKRATDLAPGDAGAWNDRGLAQADLGRLDEAVADYDEAIRLGPDAPIPYNNRAFAKRLLGDPDGALKDATMALQLKPDYARAFLNRGLCLYDLREWEDAEADLRRSIELEPEGQDFTRLRLWLLGARLGRRELATRELKEWLGKRAPVGDWIEAAGRYLIGERTEEELLASATDEDPASSKLRASEARFLAGTRAVVDGRTEDAREHFVKALATGVRNTEVIRSVEAELAGILRK